MKTSLHKHHFPRTARRASVLVVVTWIVFGLISLTLYFASSMTFELRASDNRIAGLEADQAIEAARRYITCVLSNLNSPGVIPDPQSYLREAVPVGNAKFWLIGRTNVVNLTPDTVTFGLIDEASKLNLNNTTLVGTNLALLPRMTLDLAYNIMAWRSTNTTSTTGGAESDTYLRLQPPYLCKNAPFETVDELRLVYNMDIDILYGEDANLNGIVDANENDGDANAPSDNMDGRLDPGLLEYLTIYTHEPANQTNGQPRIDVSLFGAATQLRTLLQSNGVPVPASLSGPAVTFTSPLQFLLNSRMNATDFQKIEADIRGPFTNGLININTASAAVLQCLPGMDTNTAVQLVTYRQSIQTDPNNQNTITWLAQAPLQPTQLGAIGPWITGRTYQFTADVAAVGHNGRGYRRVRFVFDTSSGVPRVVHRQDLGNLGWALGKQVRNNLLAAK